MALGRTIAAAAAALALGAATVLAQAPGRWVTDKFAPLPDPEEEYTAVTANDRRYLIGGNRGGRPQWPRVLELPGMPTARHGVNVAAFGNRLHVIGGHLAFAATGGEPLHSPANEVFEFNAINGSR